MKRRSFINQINSLGIGIVMPRLLTDTFFQNETENEWEYMILNVDQKQNIDLPEDKRIPFSWPALRINPDETIFLKPDKKIPQKNCWLRVSVAQEIRDEKLLRVKIANSEIYLGAIDIRFSSVLVPYQMELKKEHISKINENGLELTLEAPTPLWIFGSKSLYSDNRAFLPHILTSDTKTGKINDFLDCFLSISSVQAFGWREGTVLDGLWQIYKKKDNKKAFETIKQHFDLFFDEQNNLVYEDGHSRPVLNQISGIESTIPFATLARLEPNHPILDTVVEGWEKLKKPDGTIMDGTMISAEGCYTVAYPMAVIGKAWNDKKLMEEALSQLKHRFVLYNDNSLYLRYYKEGRYTYKNWARGTAWNLLGFIRTIEELKDFKFDKDIVKKFQEGIEIAVSMQRKDGLWSCFMHRHEIVPDTGGSAGIAAAILSGIEGGYLPEKYKTHALRCWEGLQSFISPDGFLQGVAQDNRAGEKLQESNYRVIAQMGMGLTAQLYADL